MKIAPRASLILLAGSVLSLTSCMPTDNELIRTQFHTELPGYSSIKVLDREVIGSDSSRTLTLSVKVDGYPGSVVCRANLTFHYGDPSYTSMEWDTLECREESDLVQQARAALRTQPQPVLTEPAELLLKRWIDLQLIALDDIKHPTIRERVNHLMSGY